MALCPDCDTVIPCHCHLVPPVQIRPGVYPAGDRPIVTARIELPAEDSS
jgi:hypothetical protein